MPTYFPALLDSVRFAASEEPVKRVHRGVRATSTLMLDLLVGRDVPVLSQAQVLDGALLLETVAQHDGESAAVLRLIADSRIQMRIHAGLVTPQESDSDTFSLVNAFTSAIDGSFKFSAWPELSDADARKAIKAAVTGRSRDPLPEPLLGTG